MIAGSGLSLIGLYVDLNAIIFCGILLGNGLAMIGTAIVDKDDLQCTIRLVYQ
jgi:hypothetical protein